MTCGRFSVGKGGILLPMDAGARAMCSHIGDVLDVEAQYDRDMVYHNRIFATIRELADAVGQSPEWMRAQLLTYCGLFHIVSQIDGKHVIAVNSMSRHSMRDEELHAFWNDCKPIIADRVLPLIANETVRDKLATAVSAF